jgi:hypothetical protein
VAADQSVAVEVLRQWQAAEASIREWQARWPALQQLLVGICATHKQLQAADISTAAVSAAVQAAIPAVLDEAADGAAVVTAASAAAAAGVAEVAPLRAASGDSSTGSSISLSPP